MLAPQARQQAKCPGNTLVDILLIISKQQQLLSVTFYYQLGRSPKHIFAINALKDCRKWFYLLHA